MSGPRLGELQPVGGKTESDRQQLDDPPFLAHGDASGDEDGHEALELGKALQEVAVQFRMGGWAIGRDERALGDGHRQRADFTLNGFDLFEELTIRLDHDPSTPILANEARDGEADLLLIADTP